MADVKVAVALLLLISAVSSKQAGGWKELSVADESTQAIARATVQEMDLRSNSMYKTKMLKLTHAKVQVVAGMKYEFTFSRGESECRKNDDKDLSLCQVKKAQKCTVTVWIQAWLKSQQITDEKCGDMLPYNPLPSSPVLGGSIRGEGKDPEVLIAAEFAVEEMNAMSNSMYKDVLVNVTHVVKQTVAGTRYKMLVNLRRSTCRNVAEMRHAPAAQCPADEKYKLESCTIVVLDQKWNKPRFELLDTKCGSSSNATPKKPLLGGGDHDIGNPGAFAQFKQKFNKVYKDDAEHKVRFEIFQNNMKKAKQMQNHERGTAVYGASMFADMTEKEFKQHISPVWDQSPNPFLKQADIPKMDTPASFDWRDHKAVTEVKNQGSCGSCWAFSTTGNIEGQWAIKSGNLLSLSEQELVDCDKIDQGCNGGLPSQAYQEIMRLGGLETEKDYPYEGSDDKCTFKKSEAKVDITGALNISSNENDMAAWLAKNGPISIGINAMAMQFYMGGVSHPWSIFCSPESLDHGVLIVGYGTQKGWFSDSPYWIIKNSWGAGWGEKGYYLIYRGDGSCGLNRMATSSTIN